MVLNADFKILVKVPTMSLMLVVEELIGDEQHAPSQADTPTTTSKQV